MKKHDYGFCACQNRLGKTEKEKKNLSLQSIPTRPVIENSKEIVKKILKI